MPGHIVVPQRLLEPEDVKRLSSRAEPQAGRQVPAAVAVYRDRDGVADGPSNLLDPMEVDDWIVVADLQF